MIDTHCHLTDPRLDEQLDAVLERAAGAGVSGMITIGTGIEDGRRCIELCRGRAQVRCAVGVHPNYSADVPLHDVPKLRELQSDANVLALGEMGLDYHYDHSPREKQREIFEAQLGLAEELKRPVIIHCREAVDDTLAMLRKFPTVAAVFHCFTGTSDEARRIAAAGYLLGFTGALTFKKADDLREAARIAPADRILVETDAPYLTPEPMRKQKINEPAMVMHTAGVLARVRGMSVEEIDALTSANARRFFGWA